MGSYRRYRSLRRYRPSMGLIMSLLYTEETAEWSVDATSISISK